MVLVEMLGPPGQQFFRIVQPGCHIGRIFHDIVQFTWIMFEIEQQWWQAGAVDIFKLLDNSPFAFHEIRNFRQKFFAMVEHKLIEFDRRWHHALVMLTHDKPLADAGKADNV